MRGAAAFSSRSSAPGFPAHPEAQRGWHRRRFAGSRARRGCELRAETREEVEKVRDSHINWRILGVVILLVGIALVTAGNLV